MIVTTNELFKHAYGKYAVGAYNINNLEQTMGLFRGNLGFAQFLNRCVTHWHFYKFTREATSGKLRTYNSG
jgi:hypothetical protein